MKVLGLAAPFGHDAAAALLIDGKIIAAVEEERFTRKKHAEGQLPIHSIQYCLKQAGLKPTDIDHVAFAWTIDALREHRFEFFRKNIFRRPSRAYKKFFRNGKEFRDKKGFVDQSLVACGFDLSKIKYHWVEHQIAHAASGHYFSGMKDSCVLSMDAGGEIVATMAGVAEGGNIRKVKEIVGEDALGEFYATMTDYLGFERGDGEYKVMGMAPFGDASKINFDRIIWWDEGEKTYKCNHEYVWVDRNRRFRTDKVYSKRMVAEFAPEREGDSLAEPYNHIAAATQRRFEEMALKIIDTYLKPHLEIHGNLCFSGGCALNVALNRLLVDLPYVKQLFIQPASHDAGTSLGAAAYAATQLGDKVEVMPHAYWGPEYTNKEIEDELSHWNFPFTKENNICETTANLIHKGEVVAWFQGRMEWGPRALGNRSILGNPIIKGTADKINAIIKFRELWRPFCPSILKEKASEIIGSNHPAPFMTIAFRVTDAWKDRIPEVVHVDGTCRPQIVDRETNPRFYQLIENFYKKTGVPVLINTSLNRRGEPMICSPKDALVMFEGSGLEYLAIGDYLVKKGTGS